MLLSKVPAEEHAPALLGLGVVGDQAKTPLSLITKVLRFATRSRTPTPKVLYATFRMRAPTHPKSVHPSLTPAQPCLGCLQIGPHSNEEKSLFE
jgi:hypothetical protein